MQRSIRHQLRKLPYREMRQLSFEIHESLPTNVWGGNVKHMADVLSDLEQEPNYDEVEEQRRTLLSSFFSRKKQITIQPHGSGFQIKVPSTGLEVLTEDIEDGMHQLFETLISYEALK